MSLNKGFVNSAITSQTSFKDRSKFLVLRIIAFHCVNLLELSEKYSVHILIGGLGGDAEPFTKYQSLMEMYSKQYNISLQNMLLLQDNGFFPWNGERNCFGTVLAANTKLIQSKVKHSEILLIFDS